MLRLLEDDFERSDRALDGDVAPSGGAWVGGGLPDATRKPAIADGAVVLPVVPGATYAWQLLEREPNLVTARVVHEAGTTFNGALGVIVSPLETPTADLLAVALYSVHISSVPAGWQVAIYNGSIVPAFKTHLYGVNLADVGVEYAFEVTFDRDDPNTIVVTGYDGVPVVATDAGVSDKWGRTYLVESLRNNATTYLTDRPVRIESASAWATSPASSELEPWQVRLRGLLMGAGTKLNFADKPLEGFGTLAYRGEPADRAGAHGQLPPRQHLSGRPMRWAVNVLADDDDEAEELLAEVAAAMAPVDPDLEGKTLELLVRLGGPRTYLVRGIPTRTAGDLTYLPQRTPLVDLEFVATDPRLYGAELHEVTAPEASVVGGLALPHGFPHGFGTATSGTAEVDNAGNFESFPVVTITAGAGGLINPSYVLGQTDERVDLVITLAAGDELTIDHLERTITLAGSGSRSTALDRATSTWFPLRPGANSISFLASGGGGTFGVAWRDAWLL